MLRQNATSFMCTEVCFRMPRSVIFPGIVSWIVLSAFLKLVITSIFSCQVTPLLTTRFQRMKKPYEDITQFSQHFQKHPISSHGLVRIKFS